MLSDLSISVVIALDLAVLKPYLMNLACPVVLYLESEVL